MIADKLVKLDDIADLISTEPQHRVNPHMSDLQPGLNSMMRCPLPPVNVTPDTTRQFYRGGMLPQIRVMSPPPNVLTSGSTTTTVSSSATSSKSSGSSTGTGGTTGTVSGSKVSGATAFSSGSSAVSKNGSSSSTTLSVEQVALTTQVLNPNNIFNGSLTLGKVFDVLQVSSSFPARIRLYGTRSALNVDTARPIDVSPPFGTEQGLILDVVLDTAPFTFPLEGVSGSNYDRPQNNLVYVAVTNIGSSSIPIVVTLRYVTLVS